MNKTHSGSAQNDVSRLLKQLRMDKFEFRTFDRGDAVDDPDTGPEVETPPASAAPRAKPGAVSPKPVPPDATPVQSRTADHRETLDAAFGRLIREAPLRVRRNLTLKLNLDPRPAAVLAAVEARDVPLKEVFGRLSRLG